jgi:4-diphosphocytidyl-2-C-methyl-D-erythritol kinase
VVPLRAGLIRVECLAPAKINLALHVTGRRDDGYHEIDTLVGFARPCDRLTISLPDGRAGDGRPIVRLTGPFAGALAGRGNLAALAAELAAAQSAIAGLPAVDIRLDKQIPVAAGLGGGSADAAATLLALQLYWRLPEEFDLFAVARRLGADVPMCLHSATLRARGIGERIELLPQPMILPALLVNPGVQVATQRVFAILENRSNTGIPVSDCVRPLDAGMLAGLRNDLEAPAIVLEPSIAEARAMIAAQPGCRLSRMSGSGATCFGLFGTIAEADSAARGIASARPGWWCLPTVIGALDGKRRLTAVEVC